MDDADEDRAAMRRASHRAGARLTLITSSFERLTGRPLLPPGGDLERALWEAPQAVVAHGVEADPVFFYGNRMALDLFQMDIDAFTALPSRLSAEPAARPERDRLLAGVAERGFIDDYQGVRISRRGGRFRIEAAVVWNLVDETGLVHGQAASFGRWTWIDQVP